MSHSPVELLLDHEVRHASWEDRPHVARQAVLDLADSDAELDELLLGLVEATSPLVAVPVEAGVEEAVPTTTAGLELVGEFREHVVDLLTALLDAARVEPDSVDDALGHDVVAGVLAVLEEAGLEDGLDVMRGENLSVGAHCSTFSSIFAGDGSRIASVCFFLFTQDEVPKRYTFSHLILQ